MRHYVAQMQQSASGRQEGVMEDTVANLAREIGTAVIRFKTAKSDAQESQSELADARADFVRSRAELKSELDKIVTNNLDPGV